MGNAGNPCSKCNIIGSRIAKGKYPSSYRNFAFRRKNYWLWAEQIGITQFH
jgi:hypothetical protein